MNSNHRSIPLGVTALVAAASLAFTPAAWSLGLGDVKVESYLNQPLRARIDLITQESDDLGSVSARLASARDYELIGASRESVSVPIRFTVEDIEGDAYILATSNLPLGDPVVRLIVEVNWSNGRMLREYTLFLDPPSVPEAAPAPRIDQRRSAVRAPAPTPAPAATEVPAKTGAATLVRPAAMPSGGGEYGPVQRGQTLWSIASEWSRGSGLDVNRVMIAIQRENPDAFLEDNINLLKRGAILRMPEVSDVEAIPTATAYREVVRQEEAFTGRVIRDTVASPETPLLAGEAAPIERSSQPQPQFEPATESTAEQPAQPGGTTPEDVEPGPQQPAPQADAPQDLLELVPPSSESELDGGFGPEEVETDTEAGADADVEALRENLARTEEELINQQQQNAYLEERLRELESQVEAADDEGVADTDLANMEDRLQAQRQADAAARHERPAEQPWYARWTIWLVVLLALAAVIAGWLFSRRGRRGVEGAAASAEDSLRDIKSEAEDVLRVLADGDKAEAPEADETVPADEVDSEAPEASEPADAGAEPPESDEKPASSRFGGSVDDAEFLDEESSDPEIQLDLARAYISMGDKEAARVILEEVVNNGTDAQQEEARKMLDLLA